MSLQGLLDSAAQTGIITSWPRVKPLFESFISKYFPVTSLQTGPVASILLSMNWLLHPLPPCCYSGWTASIHEIMLGRETPQSSFKTWWRKLSAEVTHGAVSEHKAIGGFQCRRQISGPRLRLLFFCESYFTRSFLTLNLRSEYQTSQWTRCTCMNCTMPELSVTLKVQFDV